MHCRNCDYVLWNIAARKCPECGEPFAPSEHTFVPNSVRYCCPHCDTAYYGTDENGHLVPRAFDCVQCGERIAMDEMVLRPAEGVRDEQTRQIELPWENRAKHGFIRAWFKTLITSISSPGRMITATARSEANVNNAFGYLAFNFLIVVMIGLILPGLLITAIQLATGGSVDEDTVIGLLIGPAIGFAVVLLVVAIWAAVTHGVLRISGGTEGPLGRTFQCLAYSSGPMIIAAIPLLGLYCFTFIPVPQVWWIIIAILMVQTGQGVSGLRATLATGAFPAIVALAALLGFFGLIFFSMNMMQTMAARPGGNTGMNWATGQGETALLQTQMQAYRAQYGRWPAHALELVETGSIDEWDFIASASDTVVEDVPLGRGITLADHVAGSPAARKATIAGVIDAQPDDIIAHRLGDFVFTWHGIDPDIADPALWLIIMIEDPDAEPMDGISVPKLDPVVVADVSGRLKTIRRGDFATELAAQNARRVAAGLAPLPDPLAVRHGVPARATPDDDEGSSEADEGR